MASKVKKINFVDFLTNFVTIMKKIVIAAASLFAFLGANAEGYQINTLSAKQLGMGHTGTALKLGSESMIFNPGALGFSDKTLDISGSVTAIKADATATYKEVDYKTDNGLSTPLALNVAFKVYDNLQAGVSFYTPYGSGINWTKSWPGSMLNQKVDLKVYNIQPTVSWRITKNLSVGVGMMLSWGSVNLDKALIPGAAFDEYAGMPILGNTPAASVNLKGTSHVSIGANVGVLYDINRKWSVGANFRTKMGMKVTSGTATLSYANDQIAGMLANLPLGYINEANFASEMPCPYVLNVGASFKPDSRWTIAADVTLTGWKAYKNLEITFPELSEILQQNFNQNIPKNYKNSLTYHVGAQYAVTDRADLRLGLMVDTSPVNRDNYNPETPGMTKIEPTVGFSFRPVSQLSIDFAFMYVAGLGVDNAKCSYVDMLTQQPKEFVADYKCHAFAPSIGLSYSF